MELFLSIEVPKGSYLSPENMETVFKYIKDNEHFYRAYFKGFGRNIIEHGFNQLYQSIYQPSYLSQGGEAESAYYFFTFFKNGLLAVVQEWLERGCPETPEKLAEIIYNSVPHPNMAI
jgi:hypothetical protein